MPPTWTFAWSRPARSWAIERTAGGPPHGVYQVSRPSTVSNASTGARVPSSPTSRSRWASSVPANTPCEVGARQARSNASLRATSDHVPSGSRRAIARPSATAHARPSRTSSAVTARGPNDGSFVALPSASPNIPAPVPTISRIVIGVAYPPNAAAAARSISSRGTSRRCWAMPQRCPNGSVT
jgi:hypothetical protein